MAGQFFGRSPIVDLIPLQRAYNGVKNKIHDYIRAVAANPLLVPEGSIPDIAEFAANGLPPGEVCTACGFRDYTNFFRAFRTEYGVSPRQYAANSVAGN